MLEIRRFVPALAVSALMLGASSAGAATINLTSGVNGNTYTVQGQAGTAGTLGTDYALGSYLAGGNGGLGHGFPNAYGFAGGFVAPLPPSGVTAAGAMEATDHNWLQGTSTPIVVDLGLGNQSNLAIVFNSIDHTGNAAFDTHADPAVRLWNELIEGIEFTVYGSKSLADATAAAGTPGVFGATEAGAVPGAGAGSTFEQASLRFVFEDGWQDFGNADEGDDYASVWGFDSGTQFRYIAVYSNNTDPFIDDGFRSFDNELDAIGRFLDPVGIIPGPSIPEPMSITLFAFGLAGLGFMRRRRKLN